VGRSLGFFGSRTGACIASGAGTAAASRQIRYDPRKTNMVLPGPESTVILVERAKAGDDAATAALIERCLPLLRRWARGRLPSYARDLKETQDIVQECLVDALKNLPHFEMRGEGALQAYLRRAVHNKICNEVRRVDRRPAAVELVDRHADGGASPLEQLIGKQSLERYESALEKLRPADRELIIGRIEMQQSFEELAALTRKPSANAARVATIRAVYKLVEAIHHDA
jgi:RNA polymerase sigma factor (sigma-70 family)